MFTKLLRNPSTTSNTSKGFVRSFATPQTGPHVLPNKAPSNQTKAQAVKHHALRPQSALDKASELFFFTEILRGEFLYCKSPK